MESPDTWDLLTSSLAVSNLDDSSRSWAFLVLQGLVLDQPGNRETFESLVREVFDEGPITGPSEPNRIARRMSQAGLTRPTAATPDPAAKLATARRAAIEPWWPG